MTTKPISHRPGPLPARPGDEGLAAAADPRREGRRRRARHARHQQPHRTIQAVAARAPGFGHRRIQHLGDVAAFTGGEVIADEAGLNLAGVRLEHLGGARRVIVTADSTTIIEGTGSRRRSTAGSRDPRRARARGPRARHRDRCRSASRAWLAAGRDPGRRRRPSGRSRSACAAPRARWPRPGPPSPRASCPAAAPRCCAPASALDDVDLEGDSRAASTSCAPCSPSRCTGSPPTPATTAHAAIDQVAGDARGPRPRRADRRVRRPVRERRHRPGAGDRLRLRTRHRSRRCC